MTGPIHRAVRAAIVLCVVFNSFVVLADNVVVLNPNIDGVRADGFKQIASAQRFLVPKVFGRGEGGGSAHESDKDE